jgi:DNA-binding beta-propeller fold protein YncE
MRIRIFVLAAVGLALAAGAAAKGPAPGISSGPQGVVAPSGTLKYVAMGARGGGTIVRAIRLGERKVVRSHTIRGRFGIAVVTFDGSTGGVSADGTTLVLPSLDRGETTRFAVLSTATLRVRKVISLDGLFSYDAISPDGRILYVIEYLSDTNYRVRAVNVATGGLYQTVVVDKREAGEPMTGYPVTRATSSDGSWAYTLYGRDSRPAFVHALGTPDRIAICIDLPWTVMRTALMHVRMAVTAGGSQLVLRDRAGKVAVVDLTNSWQVTAIRKPR